MAKANPLSVEPTPAPAEQPAPVTSPAPEVPHAADGAPTVEELLAIVKQQGEQMAALAAKVNSNPKVHDSNSMIHGVPSVKKQKITLPGGIIREDF